MYGIYVYIWLIFVVDVGKYTIRGPCGLLGRCTTLTGNWWASIQWVSRCPRSACFSGEQTYSNISDHWNMYYAWMKSNDTELLPFENGGSSIAIFQYQTQKHVKTKHGIRTLVGPLYDNMPFRNLETAHDVAKRGRHRISWSNSKAIRWWRQGINPSEAITNYIVTFGLHII